MTVLLLAAALPLLYVEEAPSAGIEKECVAVAPAAAGAWKGRCAEVIDLTQAKRLPSPGVQMRMNRASATRSPWIDTNGAEYARQTKGRIVVKANEGRAALAAAEAFAWGIPAIVQATPADRSAFFAMRQFLARVPERRLVPVADFGFVDDGSPEASENLNLLIRRNLQFRTAALNDSKLPFLVKPKAGNPSEFAYEVRKKVTDAKRSLRLYGSEVVVARLWGGEGMRRVHLLNYGGRPAEGTRIRVAGEWPKIKVHASDGPLEASDIVIDQGGTEFSLARLTLYAIVDLER